MAKMLNETITIEISQLVKNSEPDSTLITDDDLSTLQQVVENLVGDRALVEVERQE